jgi:hypothetical protein
MTRLYGLIGGLAVVLLAAGMGPAAAQVPAETVHDEPWRTVAPVHTRPHHQDVTGSYRVYKRTSDLPWYKARPQALKPVYVPRRWVQHRTPHHTGLADRSFGRIWWCDRDCGIAEVFGFGPWNGDTVVSDRSVYSFPAWEALEYNRTDETSLWESNWGYVEFTPTRTFTRRFRAGPRPCRDYVRIVVRHDGRAERYTGTACRNPYGEWWIIP